MRTRTLGTSGIQASVVGMGAWAIGGWMWGGSDDREAVSAIHAGMDAGINLIDTAPMYGFGRSEEVVGRAIADRRDRVVLATKCGLIWHKSMGERYFTSDANAVNPDGDIDVYKCLDPDTIRWEVEQSLRRLRTDRIDVLQTHWQESTTPICDTMAALIKLRDEGKILAIGCSNAPPAQMDEYRAGGDICVDQERYSMLDRDIEKSNLPYCQEHGIALFAYSPLAQGLLTGRVTPDREFPENDQRRTSPRFSVENRKRVLTMLDEFRHIAEEKDISMVQLAMAWTLARPGCTHVLAGARNDAQARENAHAGDVTLSEQELSEITNVLDRHAPHVK